MIAQKGLQYSEGKRVRGQLISNNQYFGHHGRGGSYGGPGVGPLENMPPMNQSTIVGSDPILEDCEESMSGGGNSIRQQLISPHQ